MLYPASLVFQRFVQKLCYFSSFAIYAFVLQTIQNTVNTSPRIIKTVTHYKTHAFQNKLKQPLYKIEIIG